jgi:large subunit ribosomal protein L20
MSRVKRGVVAKARHKKIIKLAKGYRGRSKNCFKAAKQRVEKALQYAYRDRRNKKRDFRALWIQRINAAASQYDVVYSQFMRGLEIIGHNINRKMLSEIAIHQPEAFKKMVCEVKEKLTAIALEKGAVQENQKGLIS